MPEFSNKPPEDPRGYGLPLVRTPTNGKLIVAITCDDMVGCPTHWFGARTTPCDGPDCTACKEGTPWRWHGYLSGLMNQTRRHVLTEFTAQACETIAKFRVAQGTLRGTILVAQRHRNRHNGRVLLTLNPGDIEKLNLPKAPDLISALSIIWNLPASHLEAPTRERGIPRIQNDHDPQAYEHVQHVREILKNPEPGQDGV